MIWRCRCGTYRPVGMAYCRVCGGTSGPSPFSRAEIDRLLALRHRVQSGELWGDTRDYLVTRLEWLAWLWERGLG